MSNESKKGNTYVTNKNKQIDLSIMHGHCCYILKLLYNLIIVYFLILFKILKYDCCSNSVSDCKLIVLFCVLILIISEINLL